MIEKRITDNRGNQYVLDEFKWGRDKDGYILEFCIWENKIPKDATRIDLDMVVGADDLRLHIKDTVIRVDQPGKKWRSQR